MTPYTYTLEQARTNDILISIANVCGGSNQFRTLLNEGQEGLAIRGNWLDEEQRVNFCLSSCFIAWPHFVGTVLGVSFCGGVATMQNQWYSFVNNNYGQNWQSGFGGISYGGGEYGGGPNGWGRGGGVISNCIIEDAGTRPCYNEVSGTTGKTIRYCVTKTQDYGKKITLFGKQFGAQPLQEQINGAWVNGMTLTAANPFGTSATIVTQIDAITRDATQGVAYLYEYDSSTGLLRDLAKFEPSETNPRLRCSRIMNPPNRNKDANGVCWTNISALVKLKFIPVVAERDFLMMGNLRALKFAMLAVQDERNKDNQSAVANWTLAVQELSLELNDKQPKREIPVRVGLGRVIQNPI